MGRPFSASTGELRFCRTDTHTFRICSYSEFLVIKLHQFKRKSCWSSSKSFWCNCFGNWRQWKTNYALNIFWQQRFLIIQEKRQASPSQIMQFPSNHNNPPGKRSHFPQKDTWASFHHLARIATFPNLSGEEYWCTSWNTCTYGSDNRGFFFFFLILSDDVAY